MAVMPMDLNAALGQFDLVEANLRRLEVLWEKLTALIPGPQSVVVDLTETQSYSDLCRAFDEIRVALPAIGGWRLEARIMPLVEIAQNRLDAGDVGEFAALAGVEEEIFAPGDAIAQYRFKFARERQKLVRERVRELIDAIDFELGRLIGEIARDQGAIGEHPGWLNLRASISEVERLVGGAVRRVGRWTDLARHLSFALGIDLHDIADHDWPSVRADIEAALYSDLEPIPVDVADLAAVTAARPVGVVSTALSWEAVTPADFERLIFNIIGDASGYENPKLLTRTSAPDRGRDLSVERVLTDSLSGVTRQRVIIQCKHWRSKSVAPADLAETVAQMELWEPPPVDILIVATSGRFTSDAVAWAEKHGVARKKPAVELWAETHLESLLAERPHLVKAFRLR